MIRQETPDDADAIDAVHRAAFEGEAEGALVRALRTEHAFRSDLSLVSCVNGDVVGHVLFHPVSIEGTGQADAVFALAPVGVLPAHQRQGHGSALITEGLHRLRACDAVIVLGDPQYYRRFGFVSAARFDIRGPWDVPEGVYQVVSPCGRDLATLSGQVRYPPPFDAV